MNSPDPTPGPPGRLQASRGGPSFPFWGAIALPAGLLWGVLLGIGIGFLSGNAFIGAAIGAAIGIGIGLSLFAAAIVVVSDRI